MSNLIDVVEALRGHVSRIASADGPPDVFRVLLDGAAIAAPRCAVHLVRRGVLHGWGSSGYDAAASSRLRSLELQVGAGWPAFLADPNRPSSGRVDPGDPDRGPDFGQPAYDEARGYALRVTGKTLGVVVIERDAGQEPWCPPAVPLLLEAARLRLEADLARRKLRRALDESGSRPSAAAEGTQEGAAGGEAETGAAEAPRQAAEASSFSAPESTDVPEDRGRDDAKAAPAPETGPVNLGQRSAAPAAPAQDVDPQISAARRFARLVATDIRLYNEESVLLGRRHRDLGRRLREQIDRGRETFERRFPDLGDEGRTILRDAFVQVLAGGDEGLLHLEE